MNPHNKPVILITGGAQGIGKGIAHHLLTQDMTVVIADVDAEAGEETLAEYRLKGDIRFIPTDVTNESSVQQMVAETLEQFGRINGLVNNAGIANPRNTAVEHLTLEDWNRVIATNLTGYFLCAKHTVPSLRATRGAIVNIASTRAMQSEPHTEAYAASKGGIVAFTHALALSLGPDVRVNCISPGWIEVNNWKKRALRQEPELSQIDHCQHPAGRVGMPQDIAAMTAFLLSEVSGFITGQNFVIDGGMTKKMIYAE
ncbi:SDR family oxidoreductase [candidate division KSB3 bacterium]|uniref:SDR family oxidoreductase n=1 Tax=candidate division KSB3 bacterium TaxID=2044937 RepID=A0A9D5Q5Z5_9BACT|nr:SDR family oxidoreductase [candidate division KSB3 bacterium]MBD3324376.1 SDR family oxidoreductase [candidate division KSB3 bacterium]